MTDNFPPILTKLVNLTAHVADVSFTLVLKDAVRLWDYLFINMCKQLLKLLNLTVLRY